MDDVELDVHRSALVTARAVLARYWPEATVPLDAGLLAARMGIDVELGAPANAAAVTAVRDERGARVVIAEHLHPSVREVLLVRAIGHLSRPPALATDVTDEFTRSFRRALLAPEPVLDTLRRAGLSWPEVDERLGVSPGTAIEQWEICTALRRRPRRADAGRAPVQPGAARQPRQGPPRDAVTGELRRLLDDLRARLQGLATVTWFAWQEDTSGRSDGLRDVVVLEPRAAGAVRLWWGQTFSTIRVGLGHSEGWTLRRDARGVAEVAELVDAAVLGRVEVGGGDVAPTHRVRLADGTVLDDSATPGAVDARVSGPLVWTPATAYVERRHLLAAIGVAVRDLIARGGADAALRGAGTVDAELSAGVEAYLRRPHGPGARRDAVLAVAGRRAPERLLAEVEAVVAGLGHVPLAAARGDFSAEVRLVAAYVDARHPRLTAAARGALADDWAFSNR